MLKKVSLVLSVLATFGFAVAISAPADAKEQPSRQQDRSRQQKRSGQPERQVNKYASGTNDVRSQQDRSSGHRNFVVGRSYDGHIWYGHNRHRWHGRWYDYGEGPCWINVDGEWFWNILALPDLIADAGVAATSATPNPVAAGLGVCFARYLTAGEGDRR